jgi:hypothetical protein
MNPINIRLNDLNRLIGPNFQLVVLAYSSSEQAENLSPIHKRVFDHKPKATEFAELIIRYSDHQKHGLLCCQINMVIGSHAMMR